MKVRFFKLDKNKKYNYLPRYWNEKKRPKAVDMASRIRLSRDQVDENTLNAQWQKARIENRNRSNKEINLTMVIVFLILLFIALYILDFDYSIFLKKS